MCFFTTLHAATEESDSIHEVSCRLMHCPNWTGLFTRMFLATYLDYLSPTPVFFVFAHCFAFVTSSAKVPTLTIFIPFSLSACDTTDVLTRETCKRTVHLYELSTCVFFLRQIRWMWSFDMLFRNDLERHRALFYDQCWKAKWCFVTNESPCFIFDMLEQSTIRIYLWVFIWLRLWH